MRIPSAKTRRDMELAAELRAAGATWDTVAERLHRRTFVVQRWGTLYPEEWDRMLREAEERHSRQGSNESRSALRVMLRDKDLRLRISAADKLIHARLAELAQQAKADPREDLSAFMSQVQEMTDEELEETLTKFVEHCRARDQTNQSDRDSMAGAAGAEGPG